MNMWFRVVRASVGLIIGLVGIAGAAEQSGEFRSAPAGTRFYFAEGGFLTIQESTGFDLHIVDMRGREFVWHAMVWPALPGERIDANELAKLWPLAIGKSISLQQTRLNSNGDLVVYDHMFRVVGIEDLEVGDVSYRSFVVEHYLTQTGVSAGKSMERLWYAQAAGFILRREYARVSGAGIEGSSFRVIRIEMAEERAREAQNRRARSIEGQALQAAPGQHAYKLADGASAVERMSAFLVGTWEGTSPGRNWRRDLLVRSIEKRSESNDVIDFEAYFGEHGGPLGRKENFAATLTGDQLELVFLTGKQSRVTLQLAGPRELVGGLVSESGETIPLVFRLRSRTAWAPWQSRLTPLPLGKPFVGKEAELPSGLMMTPLPPGLAPEIAAYAGIWSGYCNAARPRSVKVFVHALSGAQGGEITYADGGEGILLFPAFHHRLHVSYEDGEFWGRIGTFHLALRSRADGHMDMLFYSTAKHWCAGVLSRMP